jgi:hypothetical protein
MSGRDHSCEGCGRGGFNDPDGRCECRSVIHIVWSPRRIPWSLRMLEALPYETAYITGVDEHVGCAMANDIVKQTDADVYLLSYDDQCPTPDQAARILEAQAALGEKHIVSGWQVLGWDSPYGAASKPSWGLKYLDLTPECFFTVDELRTGSGLLLSHYFAALTAVPRKALLDCPIWALPSHVGGEGLKTWPHPEGLDETYDKGCCSDWTLAVDLIKAGYTIWVDKEVEVLHLAPQHGVPAHRFTMDIDEPGVFWNRRPW